MAIVLDSANAIDFTKINNNNNKYNWWWHWKVFQNFEVLINLSISQSQFI